MNKSEIKERTKVVSVISEFCDCIDIVEIIMSYAETYLYCASINNCRCWAWYGGVNSNLGLMFCCEQCGFDQWFCTKHLYLAADWNEYFKHFTDEQTIQNAHVIEMCCPTCNDEFSNYDSDAVSNMQ